MMKVTKIGLEIIYYVETYRELIVDTPPGIDSSKKAKNRRGIRITILLESELTQP